MAQPIIKTDIEARVQDTGDIMTGDLQINTNLSVKNNVTLGDGNTDTLTLNGSKIFSAGHLYLSGAVENSSSSNTTQLVFGSPNNNHVVLSSNTNALVINKDVSTTSPQIVLYIESPSLFPSGITAGPLIINGNSTLKGTTSAYSINPATNNTYNLGTSALKWKEIYATTIMQNGNKVVDIANASGTANKVAKFSGGNTLTNSIITDSGTEVSIGGKFSVSNGAKITGRYNNSGDDEGIIVAPANNGYAGICLGDPAGKRTVLYLMPDGSSQWRWHNGTTGYNLNHPGITGTALGTTSSGTENRVLKFNGSYSAINSNITDDGSTITLGTKIVVQGNGSSYNEGIRILPASNGWSNIFFSGDSTVSGTHAGGWLIGRRGAAGGVAGAIGDFTIENNESNGSGLTIHQNGGITVAGKFIKIANKVTLNYNTDTESLDFIFN